MKNWDYAFIAGFFYVGWFGSIFLAKTTDSIAALFFPLLLLGFLIAKKSLSPREIRLALAISLSGIMFDALLIYFGFISASGVALLQIPVWLVSIWFLFSLSMIKLGLKFQAPLWLAALLGAVMGPLSYKSGEYFQVLTFTSTKTFLIYAIFWAIAFPTVLFSTKRLT